MSQLLHPEDANPARSLWQRVEGGLSRRANAWRRRQRGVDRATAADRAWTWLFETDRFANRSTPVCATRLATALRVAVEYRHRDVALGCVQQLLELQRTDGAWSHAHDEYSSRVVTACVLQELKTWQAFTQTHASQSHRSPFPRRVSRAVQRATGWLADVLSAHSQSAAPIDPLASPEWEYAIACQFPETSPTERASYAQLAALSVARRSLARLEPLDIAAWRTLSATEHRALVANRVCQALATSAQLQRATYASLIALAAELVPAAAAPALERLVQQQLPSGAFAASASLPISQTISLHFLLAERRLAADSFQQTSQPLLPFIASDDGRVQALLKWSQTLPRDASLVDVGCGSGRYLRQLQAHRFAGRLIGVDLDPPASTGQQPFAFHAGSLLDLPLGSGACDGAVAIESLEHALLPRRAIAEICRIVRPGGKILIIDKQRRHQPLSLHKPWERWFDPAEVAAWLAEFCDDVTVRPVAHAGHRQPTGLFLVWTATRRGARRSISRAA
jgi:SAM-dependent methyltransferase